MNMCIVHQSALLIADGGGSISTSGGRRKWWVVLLGQIKVINLFPACGKGNFCLVSFYQTDS
jgi:hypothetical protein